MNRQAWRDFFITLFFLGMAFVIALLSSIAAEQNMIRLGAVAAAISLLLALLGALYIIPRLARNIRLDILRLAIRTSVTVEGLLFVVLLAIIGFAAWNTQNNLLYLILSAMLAFLLAANLLARFSLANVAIQLRFPDHVFAGEPAILSATLVNHKKALASYSVTLDVLSESDEDRDTPGSEPAVEDGLQNLAYFVVVPPKSRSRQRSERSFSRRGRYPITGFRVATRFPAGFFKKWRIIDANGEILVYPKPRPLDDFYHALPMLTGQVQSDTRGSGDDLYSIRRYHPTDHMRQIHWKATARAMQIMVRENTREDERRLTIVFDTSRPATRTRAPADLENQVPNRDDFIERFERAIVMAASLANHFVLERADVELVTPDAGHNVPSGSGHEHLYRILRSLATLQPESIQAPAEPQTRKRQRTFGRLRKTQNSNLKKVEPKPQKQDPDAGWKLHERIPLLTDERQFKVLITSASKGTIPANVWRSAHVVFMEDL